MQIIQKYLPPNTLRRPSIPILGVKFIVAHDTGNDGSTAEQNVDYYIKSANEIEASAHAFVDDLGVIECIPETEKAYHVRRIVSTDNARYGVDAIDYALGIELCYFSTDKSRSILAYNNYVEYIKSLCTKYNLDPTIYVCGHFQLDPERRTDPVNAFNYIGKTWEQFIQDLGLVDPLISINVPKSKLQKLIDYLKTL